MQDKFIQSDGDDFSMSSNSLLFESRFHFTRVTTFCSLFCHAHMTEVGLFGIDVTETKYSPHCSTKDGHNEYEIKIQDANE